MATRHPGRYHRPMTCHRLGSLLALVSLGTLGTLAIPAPGRAQPTARDTVLPAATSPLALRASRTLANGLRAHVVHLPSAATMAILVTVPVGSAQDPPGLGTLAHFAEHLQFSDHRGRTTAEIEREIAVRGGRTNASTGPDRTTYYLSLIHI